MALILIAVNKRPIYKIQRPKFSKKDGNEIVEQLNFASYNEENQTFECQNQTTADLIYGLFVSRFY